jgi:dolichol-phosphate mannosyltransferase
MIRESTPFDKSMKLSVIVPAYNEEKRIGGALSPYLEALERHFPGDYEVLAVCDGCVDRTVEIVRTISKQYPALRALWFPDRLGKGGGVWAGFAEARGEILGFVDSDGAFPVEDVFRLIKAVQDGADCAIASKWKGRKFLQVPEPFLRKAAGRILSGILRLAFGFAIADTQAGCKFFKAAILRGMPPLRCRGWEFDVELLWHVQKSHGTIREFYVPTRHVEGSKFRMSVTSRMLGNLVKLRLGLFT